MSTVIELTTPGTVHELVWPDEYDTDPPAVTASEAVAEPPHILLLVTVTLIVLVAAVPTVPDQFTTIELPVELPPIAPLPDPVTDHE